MPNLKKTVVSYINNDFDRNLSALIDQLHVKTKVCNNCDNTSEVQSRRHFVALKYGHIWDFPVSLIASNFRLLPCNSSLRIP